jgi:long-chain acyl-CoA synthetase
VTTRFRHDPRPLPSRRRKVGPTVQKKDGVWTNVSAEEFGQATRGLALGLALLGVDRHDRVAILSENRPEWPMTDFATLALGALTGPIYTSYLAPQVEYILKDSMAKVVVVSNAVELQKVLDVRARARTFSTSSSSSLHPGARGRRSPATVVQRGSRPRGGRERLRGAAAALEGSDATMIYTSGRRRAARAPS